MQPLLGRHPEGLSRTTGTLLTSFYSRYENPVSWNRRGSQLQRILPTYLVYLVNGYKGLISHPGVTKIGDKLARNTVEPGGTQSKPI